MSSNSQVKNNKSSSEPTYTALPDMDLLMSLNNDAKGESNQSVSGREWRMWRPSSSFFRSNSILNYYFSKTSTPNSASILDNSDNILPDVPIGPPKNHSKNSLGAPPSPILPPANQSDEDKDIVNPPPYSKLDNNNEKPSSGNSKMTTDEDDELIRRFEALKKR